MKTNKILAKIETLSEGIKNVLEKMKDKKEAKPPQVFMRTKDEFKGTCLPFSSRRISACNSQAPMK